MPVYLRRSTGARRGRKQIDRKRAKRGLPPLFAENAAAAGGGGGGGSGDFDGVGSLATRVR